MKLYVKQNLLSLIENYDITDENGEMKYYVESELFSFGHCYRLYNSNEEFLYEIKEKLFAFLPKYLLINKNGEEVVSISKKFTLFTDSYEIEELGWFVSGDFFAHDYFINCDDKIIATIHKKWLSIGDTYEFDIEDSQNIELVLAIIVMIDQIIDSRENN